MRRGSLPTTLKLLGALALVQGVLGILRALQFFQAGSDLSRSGLLLLPILGFVAVARGGLVIAIAGLYVLFAWGVFGRRRWARAIGLAACALNVLAVLGLVLTGEPLAAALFWIVVPVILGAYLLGAPGRRALSP
jgi:hypothetical protein